MLVEYMNLNEKSTLALFIDTISVVSTKKPFLKEVELLVWLKLEIEILVAKFNFFNVFKVRSHK